MKIICLLLCILSLTTAKVQPQVGVNDVFDGVDGVIYDIPEYEDPEVSLFKLIARGIMPVVVKGLPALLNKDDKPHYQTDDIKKGLDTVITQLQEAKNKLENGNNAVYLDIDKSVLSLMNLKHSLYLDLHSAVASSKPSATPDSTIKGSSDKAPTDKYSVIKASIKKYLSPDFPVYKYFSFDIPSKKSLSSYKFPHSSFGDTGLISYLSSKGSVKQSSTDDSSSKKQSFDSISSKDENVPVSSKQPLSSESNDYFYSDDISAPEPVSVENRNLSPSSEQPLSSKSVDPIYSDDMTTSEPEHSKALTEHPAVIDKSAYEFKLLGSAIPPAEMVPYAKEVKIDVLDDVSPAKSDQAEQADKTLMRQKLSWKISTLGSKKN